MTKKFLFKRIAGIMPNMRINHPPSPFFLSTFLKLSFAAVTAALALIPAAVRAADDGDSSFFLKDGDRVCFYGDSITEQRFYGVDVQTYVRTRFPNLHVSFVNSGVGGDRVTGGWAGGIDLRLERDVFPFKPDVVTIMLGMNDASYRPFDPKIYAVYTNGYEHIIQSLQQHLPGVRIVLIEPSPYDDVTESPKFPGGYNGVLLRYSAFVRELARRHHLPCVDFNKPLVTVMKKAFSQNRDLSHEVIPGRVHPSAAGELVMAQALLQAWNAPATVTAVTLNAKKQKSVRSENTSVSDIQSDGKGISWTQNDECLPFPILALHDQWPQFPPDANPRNGMSFVWSPPEPDWDYTNAATQMIVHDSGFYHALDREPLKVTGLDAGSYELKINGQTVGEFTARELHHGVNLAAYHTPMLDQSYRELEQVWKQVQWRYYAWREVQLKLSGEDDPAVQNTMNAFLAALEAQKDEMARQQYAIATPQPTRYELTPVDAAP